ncbi:MAG: GGDEF domain-containing protein [Sandarakinorhabdus sp.]|nr:GGDEF domain-containing protein [Sandarakinorhabdus sp.]
MTIHDCSMAAALALGPDTGPMRYFTEIGTLLLTHRLPPVPDVYDLLWRYVRDEDHDLSLAIDRAMTKGSFDLSVIGELRRTHCGDMEASEVSALLEAAHDQAEALIHRIETGRTDLADYGRAIADGGARLETPIDAAGLAVLLGQLSAATATIQAANARLESELAAAAAEARGLSEKLGAAERAAITDPLTGVLNRRGTIEMLETLQAETRVNGTKLALAMVDIDHFKRVNDRFGHALGDDVLRFVARHLADRLAPMGGKVGRFGGEEFIAVLPDHDVMRATAAIDQARAQLASQIIRNAIDGSSMGRVSFSAGVSGDRHDDSCDTLIARADAALYSAKRMERDRAVPDR